MITSADGVRILTDPFNEKVGYPVPSVQADIVTTSHEHFDHCYTEAVEGPFIHIGTSGTFVERGIHILGIETYHDQEEGIKRGPNVVFKFTMEGFNICHLGDLGHILTDAQVLALGQVDVLLIPVGGTYTIDYHEAVEVVALIDPKLVIPMHYKTPAIDFPIDGVEQFIGVIGSGESTGTQEIDIQPHTLNQQTKVILLEYHEGIIKG